MSEQVNALAPIIEQPAFLPAGATASHPHKGFEWLAYVRNHALAASAAFLLVTLLGMYVLRDRIRPLYKTESIVYVSPTSPTELADESHYRDYQEFFEQQIYAVTRPDNMKRAIEANKDFWMLPGETEQNAILRLQNSLKVDQMGHSYQMSISLESDKRDGLAELVNSITSGYLITAHNDEFFDRDKQIDVLRKQKQELSDQINQSLNTQDALLGSLGIVQIGDKGGNNPYQTQLNALRAQLAEAHERRDEADAQFYAKSDAPAGGKTSGFDSPPTSPAMDPSISAIESQLGARRAALMLQMTWLTQKNPLYIQSQVELDAINQRMKEVEKEAADKLATKYMSERMRAANLESQLNSDLNKTPDFGRQCYTQAAAS